MDLTNGGMVQNYDRPCNGDEAYDLTGKNILMATDPDDKF